jgi:hypothetical protein
MTPRDLQLPDLAALGMKWPKLAAAIDKHRSLSARHRQAQTTEAALIDERPAVEARSLYEFASAIRAGKPDPGKAKLEQHDTKIATARREREALAIAVERSAHELAALLEANRAAWQAELAERLDRDRAALRAAIEAWTDARQRLQDHRALNGWLADFPQRNRFRLQTPPLAGLRGINGEAVPLADVEAALLAEAEAPAERLVEVPA